uniref:phosphoenolpyruvate carboxylase n=1 Tax=Psychrobacter sp. 16-MNA-CIBAN-0192 TaxID=3140448 RepID=UPI00331BF12D
MTEQTADMYASLRSNVGNLGQILGETMQNHLGGAFLEKVEQIRILAKKSRQGDEASREQMLELLTALP